MDDFCLFGVSLQITRHTVAETHADSDEHIALLFFQIHSVVAVHTKHTDIQRMVRWQR